MQKPFNNQIISKKSKERYVIDLTDITNDINDENYNYKFILNIIDHYSKFCGSYLLKTKRADEVLICINDFICRYGEPKILQSDNVKSFVILN